MFNVQFGDSTSNEIWNANIVVLPHIGDIMIFDSAPKGVAHIVVKIYHAIRGGKHRISIILVRGSRPVASPNDLDDLM